MKRFFVVYLLSLSILGIVLMVYAQSADYSACDDLEAKVGTIQELAGSLDSGADDLPEQIAVLQAELSKLDSSCRGLSFSSDVDGMQPVLGPIVLDGTYRVTFTTEGFVIVKGTVLTGDCERDVRTIFNEFEGRANDGAQKVLQIENCEVLLELSNISEPWTMSFEKLK